MKTTILHLIYVILAPVLSGVLLFLSYPDYNMSWLAWIGLVPLFVTIYGRHPAIGFLLSHLSGLVFFAGVCGWVLETPNYTLFHHFLVAFFLGAPFGLFGLVYCIVSRRLPGIPTLIVAPFMWVCIEYLRCNFSFLSLPWGLLAHSQYQQHHLMQISSLAGAYGLSFLIALVNATLAAFVLRALYRIKPRIQTMYVIPSRLANFSLVFVALLLVSVALIYGQTVLNKPMAVGEIRVSVAQANIQQEIKWNPKYANHIMRIFIRLSMEASEDNPDLIVWPEAATPQSIMKNRYFYSLVKQISEKAGSPLLLGSTHRQKFKEGERTKSKFWNSAFLINPDNRADDQRYNKIKLVPFGEYLPMEETIPWSLIQVPNIGSYTPGKEFTVFQGSNFQFSVTICWESIFPNLVRQFVKNGAQFIINITNEGWFRNPAIYRQYVAMNVFRAVENRVFIVRCANTGISCFIDPYGRIVDRVKDDSGRDIFVQGVLTKTIVPSNSKTIYTRFGDWFGWLSFTVASMLLLIAILRKNSALVV